MGSTIPPGKFPKALWVSHGKNFHQVRISGNEPTLARKHLLKVLRLIPNRINPVREFWNIFYSATFGGGVPGGLGSVNGQRSQNIL